MKYRLFKYPAVPPFAKDGPTPLSPQAEEYIPLASTVSFCIRCLISVPFSFKIEDSGPGSPPAAAEAKLLSSVNSVANKSISNSPTLDL